MVLVLLFYNNNIYNLLHFSKTGCPPGGNPLSFNSVLYRSILLGSKIVPDVNAVDTMQIYCLKSGQ